jgi:Spy/CpxP family protein refolding chaperone
MMKAPKLLFLALTIIAASAGLATAQVTADIRPGVPRQTTKIGTEQDNDLINEIFSPITERLNLTATQKFRIANIATDTMLQAEPLFRELADLDDQLSEAAFTGRLEESTIRQVSEKQGALMSEIISMKVRAKMSFYRLLTAEQRAVVADQLRSPGAEGSLGSISN